MIEQEPCEINYYLEDSDEARKHIKEVLDEQYDILDFPKEERVYTIKQQKDLEPLYDKLDLYVYKLAPYHQGEICFGGEKDWYKKFLPKGENLTEAEFHEKYMIVQKEEGTELALCRITLGIKILSDLALDGYCSLDAEL